jgi:hypothetical protein
MATLQTQYKNYLDKNPLSEFTYDQWLKWHGDTIVDAFKRQEKESKNNELTKNICNENNL